MKFRLIAALVAALVTGVATAQKIQINGAGATFPNPIYSKWFSEYNKLHPDIQINYQPIGSGGGIRQLTNQTVFFGATDGPMTNDQIQAAGAKVVHLPTVLGAVVPIYEVAGVSAPLKFSGPLLADIFLGKVTKWNDAAIAAENASVSLPAADTEGKMPPDFRVSITNAPGKDVYPIASFTWLLLYESAKDKERSKAMVDFVKWALGDGQRFANELGYAPLPASVVKMELAALARIK